VDEVSRLLSGLKRKAKSEFVPLVKIQCYSVQSEQRCSGRRQASFINFKLSDIAFSVSMIKCCLTASASTNELNYAPQKNRVGSSLLSPFGV